jgi:hypothetical protein
MKEQITIRQLFEKIENVMEIHHKQLNEQYEFMSDVDRAYDEGYLNALDYVRRLIAFTVVEG